MQIHVYFPFQDLLYLNIQNYSPFQILFLIKCEVTRITMKIRQKILVGTQATGVQLFSHWLLSREKHGGADYFILYKVDHCTMATNG